MTRSVYLGGVVVWLSVAGAAASGCGQAVEYCDLKCECELCNDRVYDACVIDKDGDIEEAEAYGCEDDYDELLQCRMDRADCDDNQWRIDGDDCNDESQDYHECVDDASDLGDSTGPTYCVCACTCENGSTSTTCTGNGCCTGQCESQCQAESMGGMVSVEESCGSGQG